MIKRLFLQLIILSIAFANTCAISGTTADLMNAGIGARPLGMGKAFAGILGGVNSVSFNPAGLGLISTFEVTTMQTKILNVIDYKMYGGAFLTNYGVFGANYINAMAPAGYLTTDKGSMTTATPIAYSSSILTLSYGQHMNKVLRSKSKMGDLSFGANLKFISNSMGGVSNGGATGMDADFGFLLITSNDFNFGVVLKNLMRGNITSNSGNVDKLPAIFKTGMAYRFKQANLVAALDTESAFDEKRPLLMNLGLELCASDILSLRYGISQTDSSQTETANNITYGVGLKLYGFIFDYAYRQEIIMSQASASFLSLSYSVPN